MKCQACSTVFSDPDIVDGTAFFVCASCGYVHEIENYRVLSKDEWRKVFENDNEIILPDDYTDYAGKSGPWVAKLPSCKTNTTKYYFGEGFYVIDDFAYLDPYRRLSVFDSTSLLSEWGMPSGLVLIEGTGHAWLALDYRDTTRNPKVIVIESEKGGSLVVANSFAELVSSLLAYDEVFDSEGNIIYGG